MIGRFEYGSCKDDNIEFKFEFKFKYLKIIWMFKVFFYKRWVSMFIYWLNIQILCQYIHTLWISEMTDEAVAES